MKFLLLLVVVLALVWLLRRGRGPANPADRREPNEPEPRREAIVACAHCGLMLPVGETLPGRGGVFCSDAHRAAFETPPG